MFPNYSYNPKLCLLLTLTVIKSLVIIALNRAKLRKRNSVPKGRAVFMLA